MTVTLDLDPALIAQAEAQAARAGTTLAQFVERLVRAQLADAAESARSADGAPYVDTPDQHGMSPLPIFHGGTGGASDIDWLSNASIYAAVNEEEDERMRRWMSGESPEY